MYVVRWVTSEQLRRYMEYDQIRPSWKHFIPSMGKCRNGICFDMMTTSDWRASHKKIGLVIDSEEISSELVSIQIDGHNVYCLTERMRWIFNKDEFKREVKSAKENTKMYYGSPDELFVLGTIKSLGAKLKGIIHLKSDRTMGPKCQSELFEYSQRNNIEILKVTSDEYGRLRMNDGLKKRLTEVEMA